MIRCTKDNPDELQIHRVFGPTVLATRREFGDKALESRCLTELMHQTERKDVPDQLPEEAYQEMRELRNKLLCFRLKNKSKVDVERSQQVNLGEFEPILRQVTRCFLAVFDDVKVRREIINFLVKHQRKLIEQRATTWEGMIINAIKELRDRWQKERAKEPLIGVKEISDYISEVYGEDRLRPGVVGKILRSFDIETERKRYIPLGEVEQTRRRTVIWDDQKFDTLYRRYVPGFGTDRTVGTVGTETPTLEENRSSIYTDRDSGTDTTPAVPSVPPVPSRPTVFQIKKRLWKYFGVRPFKPSELTERFSDDNLERVNKVITQMKENGEIRLVPMETGTTVWQLTPEDQG